MTKRPCGGVSRSAAPLICRSTWEVPSGPWIQAGPAGSGHGCQDPGPRSTDAGEGDSGGARRASDCRDCAGAACYEAGRDGFWLHRADRPRRPERGGRFVEHRSQSAPAAGEDRSARCHQVVAPAAALVGGRTRVWSVVHLPTPEAEAPRQLTQEIATVRERPNAQCVIGSRGCWPRKGFDAR